MTEKMEQEANQLMVDAEKKLNSSGFLSSVFGGGTSKVEAALECYQRAGNKFKMAKSWVSAGKAFSEAASLHAKSGSKHDAATNFVDASNCYKKSNPQEAVNCLLKAIEVYTDMGRFNLAAKHHQTIGEIYETELNDLDNAIKHYEHAADFFRGEESNSSANKCMLKVAQHSAQQENYSRAIQIYEQVADAALRSPLLKNSAKEYFFKASLCHLCVDLLNAQHAMERYVEQCPSFQDAREYKFIKNLSEHVEEQNLEGFTECIADFDSISRLDQWYTTMLLRVKKQIADDSDLR